MAIPAIAGKEAPFAFAPSFSPMGILSGDLWEKRDSHFWVAAQCSFLAVWNPQCAHFLLP